MEEFIKQVEKVLLELNQKIEKQQELKQLDQVLKQQEREEQSKQTKQQEREEQSKQTKQQDQVCKQLEHFMQQDQVCKQQEREELLTVYRSAAAELGAARGEYLEFLLYSIKNAESDHEAKILRKALRELGKYEEALLDGTDDLSDAGYEKMYAEIEAYKAKVKVADLLGLIKFNNARALFLALEV